MAKSGQGAILIKSRCEGSNPSGPTVNLLRNYINMVNDKFDVEVTYADGNEDRQRWISITEVIISLRTLKEGDDMTIHHVGYAEPNVYYPE